MGAKSFLLIVACHIIPFALLVSMVNSSNTNLRNAEDCRPGVFEPTVTIANSSHLLVGWEGVFQGCSSRKLRLVLDGKKEIIVPVMKMAIALPADVCLKHEVTLKLDHTDLSYKQKILYNENTFEMLNQRRYGGLLKDVMHTLCINEQTDNGTLVTLQIPEEIQRCIRSGNEAQVEEAKHVWEPDFIRMEIINPEVASENITIDIELIKQHLEECSCRPKRIEPQVDPLNSTHLQINWNNSFTECKRDIIIKSVSVTIDGEEETEEMPKVVPFSSLQYVQVNVSSDPCENHTIIVTMSLKNASKDKVVLRTSYIGESDPEFCPMVRDQELSYLAVILIPLATTFLILLVIVMVFFCMRRYRGGFLTPIEVHHVPDPSYLPTPWSQTETESSSDSQPSSMYPPSSLKSDDPLLTPFPVANIQTELLVDVHGSTVKKTTLKRPKTDGLRGVDISYKWQLTNATSDGEEERVTILEGGGRSNTASPDPRRHPIFS